MFRYTLYVYLHVPWHTFGSPVPTPPRVYLEWLPALVVLPEPQVSSTQAYNYFYELLIMTCNHDIAYLVRAQHTPTCCRHEVVLVKREIQITICLLQTVLPHVKR